MSQYSSFLKHFNHGPLLAIISAILSALNIILYKHLSIGLDVSILCIFEALPLLLVLFITGGARTEKINEVKLWFILGVLSHGLGSFCYFAAIKQLSPILFSIIGRFQVILVLILSHLFFSDRLTRFSVFGVILMVLGGIIAKFDHSFEFSYEGIFFALLFTLSFAIRTICFKKTVCIDTKISMFYSFASSLFFALLYCLCFDFNIINIKLETYVYIAATSLICIGFGTACFIQSTKISNIGLVSSLRGLSPFFVVLLEAMLHETQLNLKLIISIIFVIIGAFFIGLRKDRITFTSIFKSQIIKIYSRPLSKR